MNGFEQEDVIVDANNIRYLVRNHGQVKQIATDRAGNHWTISELTNPRPLAVIDPKDIPMVERLLSLYKSELKNAGSLEAMSMALREFANPTPAEPTDLAARVKDSDGNLWAKIDGLWTSHAEGPRCWSDLVSEFGPVEVPHE